MLEYSCGQLSGALFFIAGYRDAGFIILVIATLFVRHCLRRRFCLCRDYNISPFKELIYMFPEASIGASPEALPALILFHTISFSK